MRNRIVIVIAAVVIGIGVAVLRWSYLRRENSVEYHSVEYWKAFYGSQYLERIRDRLGSLIGQPITPNERAKRRERRLAAHEARLLKLSYLEERRFDVWARHPETVVRLLTRPDDGVLARRSITAPVRLITGESNEIVKVRTDGPFGVVIVAPKTNMAKWEERLRRADRANNATK